MVLDDILEPRAVGEATWIYQNTGDFKTQVCSAMGPPSPWPLAWC